MFLVKAVVTLVFMILILITFCSDSVSILPSKTAKCSTRAVTFLGDVDEIKNNAFMWRQRRSAFVSVTSY